MSNKNENYPFSHFFKEGAETLKESGSEKNAEASNPPPGLQDAPPKLNLKKVQPAEEDEMRKAWVRIRSFYRNGDNLEAFPDGLAPVGLSPKLAGQLTGGDYPVWLPDPSGYQAGWNCHSFEKMLANSLEEMKLQGRETPVLERQLPRLLHIARELRTTPAIPAKEAMEHIFHTFRQQIEISGTEAEKFSENLELLKRNMPDSGLFVPFGDQAIYYLLGTSIHQLDQPIRAVYRKEKDLMESRLKEMLAIDQEKRHGHEAAAGEHPDASLINSMVRFNEISAMIPKGGSAPMEEERAARIQKVIEDLDRYSSILEKKGIIGAGTDLPGASPETLSSAFAGFELLECNGEFTLDRLRSSFESHVAQAVRFLKAMRIGELELNNAYQPEVHDDFFQHFNWTYFTGEESVIAGHFILLSRDEMLSGKDMDELSDLIGGNIPIKVIAFNSSEALNAKLEKGMRKRHVYSMMPWMFAQKNIYMVQATSLTPEPLFKQFQDGISAPAPAFFHVLHPVVSGPGHPEFMASIAVESRDFPGYEYRGLLGMPWGNRFHIDENPQPSEKWPLHQMTVLDEDGQESVIAFPFTFAEKLFFEPGAAHLFYPVPRAYWKDDLMPLADYMEGSTDENMGKVPFIWMSDKTGQLHKVAVSWEVVRSTRERLDFWRFLQENCGIGNYHVSVSVEETRRALEEIHALEIRKLEETHALEVERIRDQEADLVMENLTNALLNLDTSSAGQVTRTGGKGQTVKPTPPQKQEQAAPAAPQANAELQESDDEPLSMDPYIDTALCTSCNECIRKNGSMFKYNADHMAYIADPAAGTFKELVEAAELCPVAIIHPGTPLNPDEPELDDLIKRAEKFN